MIALQWQRPEDPVALELLVEGAPSSLASTRPVTMARGYCFSATTISSSQRGATLQSSSVEAKKTCFDVADPRVASGCGATLVRMYITHRDGQLTELPQHGVHAAYGSLV